MANVAIEIDEIKRSRLVSMKDNHQQQLGQLGQQFFSMMSSSSSSSSNLQRQSSWNKMNLSTAFESMTTKAQQHFMTWSNITTTTVGGSNGGGGIGIGTILGRGGASQQQQGGNGNNNNEQRKSIISLWGAKSA